MASTGKKYSKTVKNPKTGRKKTVRYGAQGYTSHQAHRAATATAQDPPAR